MNLNEERANYFQDFKNNKKPVYGISGNGLNAAIPHLTFRKLNEDRIAILTWMKKSDAESWLSEHKLTNSYVVELYYSELMRLLDELSPSQRKGYTIELV
jgi:hypothetical protein